MKKIIIAVVFIIFLVPALASALTIDIQMPQTFSTGEQVYFDYTITSDTNQDVTFTPHILCPTAPIAFLQDIARSLQAGVPYSDTYNDIIVTERIEPQTCTASVQITSPMQQREEKTFQIDTLPSFDFTIDLEKTVFIKNEDVNLDYTSDVTTPSIIASLTSPSGIVKDIQIPSVLQLDEVGTYIINVQVSKSGYKTMQVSRQIGVIETSTDIQQVSPQSVSTDGVPLEIPDYLLYALIIVVVIVLVLVYMKMRTHSDITNNFQSKP